MNKKYEKNVIPMNCLQLAVGFDPHEWLEKKLNIWGKEPTEKVMVNERKDAVCFSSDGRKDYLFNLCGRKSDGSFLGISEEGWVAIFTKDKPIEILGQIDCFEPENECIERLTQYIQELGFTVTSPICIWSVVNSIL